MAHVENLNKNGSSIVYAGFTPTLICSGAISDTKTVTFPTGFSAASEENLAFKVVFANGHNALNPYDNMTLNGVAVVTNQQGTLAPIPIHEITESGNTVYKVLGANVALDLYYTSDYDGNGTAAYVVAGNPLVLSSTDYAIYADGFNAEWQLLFKNSSDNSIVIDKKYKYIFMSTNYSNNYYNSVFMKISDLSVGEGIESYADNIVYSSLQYNGLDSNGNYSFTRTSSRAITLYAK